MSWLDDVERVQTRTAKGRTTPADEPAADVDLAAVDARARLTGPVLRALARLALRADPARPGEALKKLGVKGDLFLDFLYSSPEDIADDAPAHLVPFASDHKSWYAFDVSGGAARADDAPIVFVDWGEGARPRRLAPSLNEWLASIARDESDDAERARMVRNVRRLLAAGAHE